MSTSTEKETKRTPTIYKNKTIINNINYSIDNINNNYKNN
jgi:hypothetical protein